MITAIRYSAITALLLTIFMLATPHGHAAIVEQITFYGTLQDSSGNALDGSYDMVFRFYDAASGGTLLDTSTHTAANGNSVTVSEGEFAVLLGSGSGNALDGLDFNTGSIYVGLSINGETEYSARELLSAATYAFNSDTVDGYDESDFPRQNGTSTFVVTANDTALNVNQLGSGDIFNVLDGSTTVLTVTDGGQVGVGTTTPNRTLSVDGDIELTGSLYDASVSAGQSGDLITTTGSAVDWAATTTFGGGSSLFTDGGTTTYLNATADYFAIGTTSAPNKFTIANGNLNIVGNYGIHVESIRAIFASSTQNTLALGLYAGPSPEYMGNDNLYIGQNTGRYITDPNISYSTFIGYDAGRAATNTAYSTSIGYRSGEFMQGTHNFNIGFDTMYDASGDYNIAIGHNALEYAAGNYNVAIGDEAWAYSPSGNRNVLFGIAAGSNGLGNDNVMVGWNAGSQAFYGANNNSVFFGELAGNYAAGANNIFVGYRAGLESNNYSGLGQNVFLGYSAMEESEQAESSVGIGYFVGEYTESIESVLIGSEVMRDSSEEFRRENVVIGAESFDNSPEFSDGNIILGYRNTVSVSNNMDRMIMIGDNIEDWNGFGTDQLDGINIANLLYATNTSATGTVAATAGRLGLGTNAPTAQLHTTGSVRLSNFGTGNLTTDAAGNVSVSSDALLKTATSSFSLGIESILNIEPIVYRWNATSGLETKSEYVGFSAQNVAEHIPETVGQNRQGYLTLSDRGILAAIVNAVSDVWNKVGAVNAMTASSTSRIAELKRELNQQEQQIQTYELSLTKSKPSQEIKNSNEVETDLTEESLASSSVPIAASTTVVSNHNNASSSPDSP